MMASPREKMLASAPAIPISKNKTTRAVDINSRSGSSLLIVVFLIETGWMTAATPISSKMLIMLLPITLPRSISVLPEIRAEIETASSGAPVPKATMVRPINCLLTLKCEATDEEPETSQSAPLIRRTKPMTSNPICNAISMFLFRLKLLWFDCI